MATSAATSAREILTGLHEIMAKRGSAQSKLDQVVDLIAQKMESEVSRSISCAIIISSFSQPTVFARRRFT
jgi:phosphotransferase system enzyme I (PtsP)